MEGSLVLFESNTGEVQELNAGKGGEETMDLLLVSCKEECRECSWELGAMSRETMLFPWYLSNWVLHKVNKI